MTSTLKNTRITVDLEDPNLLKLLKAEAQEKNSSMKAVLITALEGHFQHKLEQRFLYKSSDAIFQEWANDKDADYDAL